MAEEQVIAYKCPNCHAGLKYDAGKGDLFCEYCESRFSIEETEKSFSESAQKEKEPEWEAFRTETLEGLTEYICQSCGAHIAGDENTVATACPYCGNPAIIAERIDKALKPDGIIPFRLSKEQAKDFLSGFFAKRILLPKEFTTDAVLEKVTGVYVPFWLYDCDAKGRMTFRCTRVHSWRRGEYRITRTDHFLVTRGGTMDFEKIPVDASSKMDNSYMDSLEPFDYSGMVPFSSAYLPGFFADRYDEDEKQCAPRAEQRARESIKAELRSSVFGYASVREESGHFQFSYPDIHYVLFPVYLLSMKYREKNYLFAMNGQTGKYVGKLPVSAGRFFGLFLGIAAGCMALAQLILFLMGGAL